MTRISGVEAESGPTGSDDFRLSPAYSLVIPSLHFFYIFFFMSYLLVTYLSFCLVISVPASRYSLHPHWLSSDRREGSHS